MLFSVHMILVHFLLNCVITKLILFHSVHWYAWRISILSSTFTGICMTLLNFLDIIKKDITYLCLSKVQSAALAQSVRAFACLANIDGLLYKIFLACGIKRTIVWKLENFLLISIIIFRLSAICPFSKLHSLKYDLPGRIY